MYRAIQKKILLFSLILIFSGQTIFAEEKIPSVPRSILEEVGILAEKTQSKKNMWAGEYLKVKENISKAKIYYKNENGTFILKSYLNNKPRRVFQKVAEDNADVCGGKIYLLNKLGWVCSSVFDVLNEVPENYVIYGLEKTKRAKKKKVKKQTARGNMDHLSTKKTTSSSSAQKSITVEKKKSRPLFKKNRGKNMPKSTIDTVEVVPGENSILIIAGNHPNRILTPFESPVVHTTSQAKFEVIGSVIYVTASLDAGPATLFVTEEDDETMALSLTLVPRAIPPKEIHLKLKNKFFQISSSKAKKWEASLPYVDMLKTVITKIAKGDIPPGYNLRNITSYDPTPICGANISLEPRQVIDGHRILVVISKATNISDKKMLFNEESCYQHKVLAVAVWPNALLEPGQSTELYVVFKKEYGNKYSKRPSLIQP